ncbi:Histone-lysine N-methyltransferase, H3 lysine-9 specific SUVH5 [Hibiscus syriacus]|uniref:Histone-lysine N-methyltransferase, H3 lysine-9 specific SUVH5 n=1 Tax=Hibiscus syriacus TaxID=106335 RepID=A0A6A3BB27_HIBSY|nr:Histone-lysine N-methyltransferase, H3 lysine-9 specific SUVH5 [Hibiscus syriacus]
MLFDQARTVKRSTIRICPASTRREDPNFVYNYYREMVSAVNVKLCPTTWWSLQETSRFTGRATPSKRPTLVEFHFVQFVRNVSKPRFMITWWLQFTADDLKCCIKRNAAASEIVIFLSGKSHHYERLPSVLWRKCSTSQLRRAHQMAYLSSEQGLYAEEIRPISMEPVSEKRRKQGAYEASSSRNDMAGDSSNRMRKSKKNSPTKRDDQGLIQVVIGDKKDSFQWDGQCTNDSFARMSYSNDVSLPPCGNSTGCTSRNKVRETLRLFQAFCWKLLQGEGKFIKRVDCRAAMVLKENNRYVNTGEPIIGLVPGVEVGDEFRYFIELNIVVLHRDTQRGIDYVKQGKKSIATSIVATGTYEDDLSNSDVLMYMGEGGKLTQKNKQPEDQKLERGNLALANSIIAKNPVRVIRGDTRSSGLSKGRSKTFVYNGLYRVEEFKQEAGPHQKLVYKFKLVRIPGQLEIAWKVVKKSKEREGLCVHDILQGKDTSPICAINTIDDEKPLPFEYLPHMLHPNWCSHVPSCRNRLSVVPRNRAST